jgi:hypothetical protein
MFRRIMSLLPAVVLVVVVAPVHAADIERDPIHYGTAPVHNAISHLQQSLASDETSLPYDEHFGYLPGLLSALKIPAASQMLVFSKTSMQRQCITARTPRAVYFNDDNYVGYCQDGAVLEILSVDPQLGPVFYTLDQEKTAQPHLKRQDDTCLVCHASSQNQGIPGLLARSLYTDAEGFPLLNLGGYRTDQTSPLKQRWGGWYVTGTTGKQRHMGNLIAHGKRDPAELDETAVPNVNDLGRWLRPSDYLTGHSDVVALMVLEHQAEMHNRITRANYLTRIALFDESELNKALGQPNAPRSDLTTRRIKSACEPLVEYMLFSGEAELADKIQGTSGFAEQFVKQGPRDGRGRSLRDLDLTKRLFAYPCSCLIYSESFDALPDAAKEYVLRRLWDILSGKDQSKEFAHLSAADRRAILEILRATKKDLPKYWQASGVG